MRQPDGGPGRSDGGRSAIALREPGHPHDDCLPAGALRLLCRYPAPEAATHSPPVAGGPSQPRRPGRIAAQTYRFQQGSVFATHEADIFLSLQKKKATFRVISRNIDYLWDSVVIQ